MECSVFSQDIQKAYEKDSELLLEKLLKNHTLKIKTRNDTLYNISQLMNAFLKDYKTPVFDDIDTANRDLILKNRYDNEKYIILQPYLNICFVEQHDSLELFNLRSPNRPTIDEWIVKKENSVFDNFLTAGFYKFLQLKNCREFDYYVSKYSSTGVPLIIDSNLIKDINIFLKDEIKEHRRKVNFLKRIMKVYPTSRVEIMADDKIMRFYSYNYTFFIKRIIFDQSSDNAFIQYSFPDEAWEAFYSKVHGNWTLQRKSRVLIQN